MQEFMSPVRAPPKRRRERKKMLIFSETTTSPLSSSVPASAAFTSSSVSSCPQSTWNSTVKVDRERRRDKTSCKNAPVSDKKKRREISLKNLLARKKYTEKVIAPLLRRLPPPVPRRPSPRPRCLLPESDRF